MEDKNDDDDEQAQLGDFAEAPAVVISGDDQQQGDGSGGKLLSTAMESAARQRLTLSRGSI